MYVENLNLRWKVLNSLQMTPAIALSVVPTLFGYNNNHLLAPEG